MGTRQRTKVAAMPERSSLRILWSWEVIIQVHLLCLVGIVAISIDLANGNAPRDEIYLLLFFVIAYPALLALYWLSQRVDRVRSHVTKPVLDPDCIRRKKAARPSGHSL
jgi:hypothetical protein